MRSRFRVLAALCALIALTLSFGEGVWASMCMPAMEMGEAPAAEMSDASDRMMDMASQGVHTGGETPDGPEPPHCPFAPVSTAGTCVAAASLPAASPIELVPSLEGALLVVAPEQKRDLLLVSALFHPPRA